jgi:PAS domain-containing protein
VAHRARCPRAHADRAVRRRDPSGHVEFANARARQLLERPLDHVENRRGARAPWRS